MSDRFKVVVQGNSYFLVDTSDEDMPWGEYSDRRAAEMDRELRNSEDDGPNKSPKHTKTKSPEAVKEIRAWMNRGVVHPPLLSPEGEDT